MIKSHLLEPHGESLWYSDMLYLCKRYLLLHSSFSAEDENKNYFKRVLSDAALIMVEVWGRGTGINARIIETAISKLKGSLEGLLEENVGEPSMGQIEVDKNIDRVRGSLWAAFVGGVATSGSSSQGWFIQQVSILKTKLTVENWERAKEILYTLLWGELWELKGKELWEKVENN